ncbi:MAG: ATP-dependent DNA helicase RecG [Anaerolineaceae bacterium]|nr:ATP-dependent DNA helicase RecG [Anaerolineaceae bacterium]
MALRIDDKVQFVKGVGPARAQMFRRLGVETVRDLLYLFPRDYEEPGNVRTIAELVSGQKQAIVAQCLEVRLARWRHVEAAFADDSGSIKAVWFNAAFLRDQIHPGRTYRLSGRVVLYRRHLQMQHPSFKELSENGQTDEPPLLVTYPATEGLQSRSIARVVAAALEQCLGEVPELFSPAHLKQLAMPSARAAVRQLHRPTSTKAIAKARRRMVFEEFFLMELAVAMRRRNAKRHHDAPAIEVSEKIDRHIRRRFPFELTDAQNRAVADIVTDISQQAPMTRLLQGDVGSGKTVVALYGILAAVAAGYQATIMTPTEILTEQHFRSVERFLVGSRVRWLLLTGSLTANRRKKALARIREGQADIVVGTQALIQQDVTFEKLGFVVVDEQHKFGVLQRAESRWRNADSERPMRPHYLVMTATPIPRTLALTVFGDLDISVIDQLPPGRQPIETCRVRPKQVEQMYERMRREIRSGRQAYVVCPLVEESDKQDLKAATEEAARLQRDVFGEFRVALLHGRMSSQEKQRIMEEFRAGKSQILVSTIVIEVGIDVENATLMVIEHAERFGLAQLHQLRGRIGRGRHKSTCFLVARPTTEFAERRIAVMTETSDGFRIAEEDLRLRGPGEFFGTRQSGLPELRIGNLIEDYDLLQLARQEATDLVASDPDLEDPHHGLIRQALMATYGRTMELIEVG